MKAKNADGQSFNRKMLWLARYQIFFLFIQHRVLWELWYESNLELKVFAYGCSCIELNDVLVPIYAYLHSYSHLYSLKCYAILANLKWGEKKFTQTYQAYVEKSIYMYEYAL